METQKYSVILVTAPDGMVFVCMRPADRLKFFNCKSLFFNNCKVLRPYLYYFYWFQFKKEVVGENLSKEEAQELVYEWSEFCRLNGVLLNQRIQVPLGLNKNRNAEYQRRWRENHKEEYNRRHNDFYWNNRERLIERQKEYNRKRKENKKAGKEAE